MISTGTSRQRIPWKDTDRKTCKIPINCTKPSNRTSRSKLYADGGIDSVVSVKRSVNSDNARRKLDGRAEARLIEIACSPAPEGHSRWTLRLLEEEAKVALDTPVGKNAIGRALKKTGFSLTEANTGASPKRGMPNS